MLVSTEALWQNLTQLIINDKVSEINVELAQLDLLVEFHGHDRLLEDGCLFLLHKVSARKYKPFELCKVKILQLLGSVLALLLFRSTLLLLFFLVAALYFISKEFRQRVVDLLVMVIKVILLLLCLQHLEPKVSDLHILLFLDSLGKLSIFDLTLSLLVDHVEQFESAKISDSIGKF